MPAVSRPPRPLSACPGRARSWARPCTPSSRRMYGTGVVTIAGSHARALPGAARAALKARHSVELQNGAIAEMQRRHAPATPARRCLYDFATRGVRALIILFFELRIICQLERACARGKGGGVLVLPKQLFPGDVNITGFGGVRGLKSGFGTISPRQPRLCAAERAAVLPVRPKMRSGDARRFFSSFTLRPREIRSAA